MQLDAPFAATNGADSADASAPVAEKFSRADGPFDAAELAGPGNRLEAGSLWLPVTPDTRLQFSTDERQETILGVVYLMEDSALQLQAFAAPKSRGIWDQVRLDMRTSIAQQGGSSQEVDGPFGKELMAMMPLAESQNFAPHRFLGIDGPRWLLRATLYGRAGADPQAAAPLIAILQNIAVNRGADPLVPRSLLPLQLPQLSQE
ncbi:DUF3710 domain-containing protein [Arcanobacterium hippocoleae]|uniref:DUF3710 domain-containing protein n=1 Tax=Arcanobacterium hippocoleae TaxID=149017 RepID=UPI00333FFB67